MEFRPCIDIHNGKVKQIVGGSLKDEKDFAKENFVSEMQAADYAALYREKGLRGGHIILLNAADSPYYKADLMQAKGALSAWQGALQVGGGIHAENSASFLDFGASHVIVTSYVFVGGEIRFDRLEQLVKAVGKEHVVLDLSCRKKGESYYIVTDRWQKFTTERVTNELLEKLSSRCSEFLVHAVDVEGKSGGIEKPLAQFLGDWGKIPITYAGGVHSFEDLEEISQLGRNRLNVTIGSALDLFGGPMSYEQVLTYISKCNAEKEKSI